MNDVKVIKLGLGEVVSNWGTFEGKPSLFIEPADNAGKVGFREYPEGSGVNDLRPGSVVLQIHDVSGVQVIAEDLLSALKAADLPEVFTMTQYAGSSRG